jgi:hypothetical protein
VTNAGAWFGLNHQTSKSAWPYQVGEQQSQHTPGEQLLLPPAVLACASSAGSSHRYAVLFMLEGIELSVVDLPGFPAMLLVQRLTTATAAAAWSKRIRVLAM